MKKVLLIVVDALTARLLEPALERGEYPAMQRLCQQGRWQESTSIFPSITHAALSSLVTGKYPREHGVLGSYWYSPGSDEVIYLGADPQVIWNEGVANFYAEFLIRLNHTHLQSDTIFQKLERKELHATCLNHIIFRGDREHQVNPPLVMELVPGLAEDDELSVMGPDALFLGDFVNGTAVSGDETSFLNTGPQNWYGFKDNSARELLLRLAVKDELHDFTLAYFPENDFIAHEQGPEAAHGQLQRIDEMLNKLFTAYGGLDELLSQFALIVTGDHSQSDVHQENAAIDLEQLLDSFQCVTAGKPWQSGDEIMLSPNLRATTLYLRHPPEQEMVQEIISSLRSAESIDQVICRADLMNADQNGYRVLTRRGDLHFWPGGEASDRYGNQWGWEGELAAVDGRLHEGVLHFGDYPNAFERLTGILESEDSGPIWATAEPGHEFFLPGVDVHAGGGSHGSLHHLDSVCPLISAGIPEEVTIPDNPRLVDVAPLCRSILFADDPS